MTTNLTVNSSLPNNPSTSWPTTGLLIFIALITIAGNCTIILVFCRDPRLRKPFNLYLLNLAISDLLGGLFGMSHLIVYTYYKYWPLGFKQCTLWLYTAWLSVNASFATIALISVNQMWAAAEPVSYWRFNTKLRTVTVIVLSWLVVNAGILPGQIHDRLFNSEHYDPYDCNWDINGPTVWASPLYVVQITEWVPAIVAVVCYVLTCAARFKRSRKGLPVSRVDEDAIPAHRLVENVRQGNETFVLLTLLISALVLCWGPWFVYSTIGATNDMTGFFVTYWCGCGMAAMHPFLFVAAYADFRQAVKALWPCVTHAARQGKPAQDGVPLVQISIYV